MALKVIVNIEIKNQAYEGGVEDASVLTETGFASVAPGSFLRTGRETLNMLVESAVSNAQKNLNVKLDSLKGK